MSYIFPIILSGGVGSRLWPLSRSHFPKQLLSLMGEQSLIQETALRTVAQGFASPLIICQEEHRLLVMEQMQAIGVCPENIILEPAGRNTAPAAAIAALLIAQKDPDALLLLMPADHLIRDRTALRSAIIIAQDQAQRGYLVTFGVHPSGADTAYGYIQRGSALREDGAAFAAARFVEKPNAETAARYVEAGDYYWNSGIFAFQAKTYLAELERLEPDILANCRRAISDGKQAGDYFYLAAESFAACKSISIDYAVMERTDRAAIVPVEMGWSDIGSWAALWENLEKDVNGNVVNGDVLPLGTRNSYLRSEGPLLATFGVEDLVVIASPDAVLVGPKAAAQDVKKIVERLDDEKRDLHLSHRKRLHPWGSCECIDQGTDFRILRFTVKPGARLSLQTASSPHHYILLSGAARLICDDKVVQLSENDKVCLSTPRQLENPESVPLILLEIDHTPSPD